MYHKQPPRSLWLLSDSKLYEISRRRLNLCCPFCIIPSSVTSNAVVLDFSETKQVRMDYQGQKLSEFLFYWIILAFGGVGWVVGYIYQDFSYVFYPWLAGVVLAVIVSRIRIYISNIASQYHFDGFSELFIRCRPFPFPCSSVCRIGHSIIDTLSNG